MAFFFIEICPACVSFVFGLWHQCWIFFIILLGAADYPSFRGLLKQLVGPLSVQLSDRRSSIVKQVYEHFLLYPLFFLLTLFQHV